MFDIYKDWWQISKWFVGVIWFVFFNLVMLTRFLETLVLAVSPLQEAHFVLFNYSSSCTLGFFIRKHFSKQMTVPSVRHMSYFLKVCLRWRGEFGTVSVSGPAFESICCGLEHGGLSCHRCQFNMLNQPNKKANEGQQHRLGR